MIALKLILLASVFNLSQISAGDRIVQADGDPGKDMIVKSERGEADDSAGNDPYTNNETSFDNFSLKEKWDASRYAHDFSGFYTERYMASIKIDGFLRSGPPGDNSARKNGLILIGLKKPYYRLDRNPHVNGRVDLQMAGSIFGVENRGSVSISYDLRSKDDYRRISTSLSFDSFLYRITIPFGVK